MVEPGFLHEPLAIGLFGLGFGVGLPVELHQDSGESVYLRFRHVPSVDACIEHAIPWQSPHLYQPLHRLSSSIQGQGAIFHLNQCHLAKVDPRRQWPVEPDLLVAIQAPLFQCAEIQVAGVYRLVELVDVSVGEEHPRHVGLDGIDPSWPFRIALWFAEEGDFLSESGQPGSHSRHFS